MRANKRGRARRGNSSHDIRLFRDAARELRDHGSSLSESKARAHARKLVTRHWAQIERTAPDLIRHGRIHL